jgi:hypothetical protein
MPGMLVEHFKEVAFTWKQLAKKHGDSWSVMGTIRVVPTRDVRLLISPDACFTNMTRKSFFDVILKSERV